MGAGAPGAAAALAAVKRRMAEFFAVQLLPAKLYSAALEYSF